MTRLGFLMIGCASLSILSSCMADSPTDLDQEQTTESELATTPGVGLNGNGAFRVLRLANTNLCLQPQGGSTGDVLVELHTCDPTRTAQEQNWLLQSVSGGIIVVNQKSGKCLYNNAPVPLFNGARPIDHESCFIFGTNTIASNALWKETITSGFSSFQSRVQNRDTGFCIDVPNGMPFDTVTFQNFRCNGTPAQLFVKE